MERQEVVRRGAHGLLVLMLLVGLFALPSVNYLMFSGLPFDSLPQYIVLLAVMPLLLWPWLRRRWCAAIGAWPKRWRVIAVTGAVTGLLIKGVLAFSGTYDGFPACYRAISAPPQAACEASYSNPFKRLGVTRVDRVIDFGPTDWSLSFVNDGARFNYYRWRVGTIPRERLPFSATWRGQISHHSAPALAVTYLGEGEIWFGRDSHRLAPSYDGTATVVVPVPDGARTLAVLYRFDDRARIGGTGRSWVDESYAPIAAFSLGVEHGGFVREFRARPAAGWGMLAAVVDGFVIAGVALLVWFYSATALSTWRTPAGGFLFVYGVAAGALLAHEATLAASLRAVRLRGGGSDFLTYEGFARTILETWSLRGGEDVFYYQPFFRYIRFLEHMVLGDGDVLISAFARTLAIVGVVAFVIAFRANTTPLRVLQGLSVGFLVWFLNSESVASLFRDGVSEYPAWILVPISLVWLFRDRINSPVCTAMVCGIALITRFDVAPGLLAWIGAAVWQCLDRSRAIAMVGVVLTTVAILPAAHNLYYGRTLGFTAANADSSGTLIMPPSAYWAAIRGRDVVAPSEATRSGVPNDARSRVAFWLDRMFHGPATNAEPAGAGGELRIAARGLQILWIVAVVLAVREPSPNRLVMIASPALLLAPQLFYNIDSYYPRHIVMGYLAMGLAAVYVSWREPGRRKKSESP